MRLILAIAAISAALCAQDVPLDNLSQPPILVQGVVVDKDTHAPIPGATVMGTRTGSSGDFQIRMAAGARNVSAQAPGYQAGGANIGAKPGQASIYIEIPLTKLQSISGVVVDDETKKPIAGLNIEAVSGIAIPGPIRIETSSRDGRFTLTDLPPGEYFVRVSDQPAPSVGDIPAKDLQGDAREKALELPDGKTSYGSIVLPGRNADIPTTPGIGVTATPVELGEIRLTKSKLQNISGLIAPCEEGASIQVILYRASAQSATGVLAMKDIKCGDGIQLLNLPDGTFNVSAIQGFPQRRYVSQTFDARTRSPLRLNLSAFVSLQISLEMEGGTKDDVPPGQRVDLAALNKAVKVDSPTILGPGSFEATVYPGERYRISVAGMGMYYIKRIFYDGAAQPDPNEFVASLGAVSRITAVLDRAGTVEAHVKFSSNSTGGIPFVVLMKEEASFAEYSKNEMVMMHPDGDGVTFNFGGLSPGRYRAMLLTNRVLPLTEAEFQSMRTDSSVASTSVSVEGGQTVKISLDPP